MKLIKRRSVAQHACSTTRKHIVIVCLCSFGPKSPREATACGGSAAPVPYVRRATAARRRHEEPENEASTAAELEYWPPCQCVWGGNAVQGHLSTRPFHVPSHTGRASQEQQVMACTSTVTSKADEDNVTFLPVKLTSRSSPSNDGHMMHSRDGRPGGPVTPTNRQAVRFCSPLRLDDAKIGLHTTCR